MTTDAVRFDGRVALVTGGGSGIGQAIAERFAAEGAHVVVADVRAAAFLASDEAAFVTGAVLTVDGGLTAGLYKLSRELQAEP